VACLTGAGEESLVALGATIHAFDIQLNDSDRQVYENVAVRVARHPSETADYLWTRVLAYCLEYRAGIAFCKGLSAPDEPAIAVRDAGGMLDSWIDIGTPDANRLHKAAKMCRRVAVYTHKDVQPFLDRLAGERIHRAEELEIYAVDRSLLSALVARLARRVTADLAVVHGQLYLSIGDEMLSGTVEAHRLTAASR
jgi:uncharacterized protein YaeQ